MRQNSTEIDTGGSLTLGAGRDLVMVASAASVGDEAYLYAGRNLAMLAAEDRDYYLYDEKKKGGWGSRKTKRDEVTTITQIGSSVTAEGDVTLTSGADQRYQAASLASGADLTLDAGGDITFEAVKDLEQESHEKSSSSWAWTSAKGKGTTDEKVRLSALTAGGELAIKAAGKIRIDVPEVNAKTVSQTIDALVEAEPELAWLKEMEARGDIDWQRVKEVHDSFEYSHSGMGGVLAIVVAIVVAVLTYGAASQAIGAAAAGTGGTAAGAAAGTTSIWSAATTTTAAGWANAAASAGLAGMASNTAVQLGTTGSVDWSQVFKTGAVSALTAGLTNYGFFEGGQSLNDLARLSAAPTGASGAPSATGGLSFSWDQAYGVMGRGIVNAGVSSAIQGTDFKDAFIGSVVGDYAALSANSIGSQWGNGQNPVMQTLAHAAVGAGAAHLTGGDAAAGAIGGVVEAGLDNTVGAYLRESGVELDQWGRLAYLAGATLAGGIAAEAAGHDGVTGAQAAHNAAANNYLTPKQIDERNKALEQAENDADRERIEQYYEQLDASQREDARACVLGGKCSSAMEERHLAQVRDELYASCAPPRICDVTARSSFNELISLLDTKHNAIAPNYLAEEVLLFLMGGKAAEGVVKGVVGVGTAWWRASGGGATGPGAFMSVSEAMSARAAAYQNRVAGTNGGTAYVVDGVKFDGFANGVLIDAKSGYAQFVKDGQFRSWFRGADSLAAQAQRQLSVANGIPVQWRFAEESAANATRALLQQRGISGISIVHVP